MFTIYHSKKSSHIFPGFFPARTVSLIILFVLCFPQLVFILHGAEKPLQSAAEQDYPPFSFVDEEGDATGFSVELLRHSLKAMDRDVKFRTGIWPDVKNWLEKGQVDVLPLVGRTPEREEQFDFTFPYMSLHGAIVVREGEETVKNLDDLRGHQVAVMKDDNAEEFLRRKERGIEIHTTPTFEDALQELSAGRHDAVVIQRIVALRLIQELGLDDKLRVLDRPLKNFRQDFCFAVKKGDDATLALLNEGLSVAMADGTHRRLRAEWFGALQQSADRRIVVGGDHNFPPFEFLDENGEPAGFAVDLTRAIAEKMDIDVEIRLGSWSEVRSSLAAGEIDVLQGMFYSPERDLDFDFSTTHAVVHYVPVIRAGEGPIPSTQEGLKNMDIAVQREDIMHDFLRENELDENTGLYDSQEEALRAVVEGRHQCAMIARQTANFLISKNNWDGLELGETPFISPEYSYAVPNNEEALQGYFNEGLAVLKESGKYREIHNKWFGVYEQPGVSLETVLRYTAMILIPIVILFLIVLLWVWTLRRKVAERTRKLEQTLEYQRAMIACSPVALFTIDFYGNVLTWNSSAERVFGWTAEEVGGEKLPIIPEDKQDESAALRKKVSEGEGFTGKELIRQHKDGHLFPISLSAAPIYDESGQIMGIMGVAQDITERKQREKRILRLNSLLRAIRNVNQIIVTESNLHTLVEKVCQSLLETRSYCGSTVSLLDDESGAIKPVATAGQSPYSADWVVTPDGEGEAPECIKEAIKKRQLIIREPEDDCGECAFSGLSRNHSMAIVPMVIDDSITGFIHIHAEAGVDIDTEEQDLLKEVTQDLAFARNKFISEEKLQEAQRQVIDQERHRALSIMASGIAHDFNNSLSTILGFTDLILQTDDQLHDQKTVRNYLDLIRKAASNAAETVRRMRKFYRPPEQDSLMPMDLNSVVEEAISMTQPRWKEQARAKGADIKIEKKLGSTALINGNEAELHEMLVNLIFNAVDAMPEGGNLSVETKQSGKQIILAISDTGMGMTDDVREHCLEPFFTLKEGQGTGLGLSTVQGTVERHYGDIEVLSAPGQGTTFRITLPAGTVEEETTEEPEVKEKVSGLNILVIEDDPDQRKLLNDYLELDHHTVDTAENGREGFKTFLNGYYNLVITDRSMPEISGDELAAQIKEQAPGKPIIMLTGFGDMIEVSEEKPENVDTVLAKPVTLTQLRNAIARIWQEK
ncbi:MAG: transporter substrate-binding domain-containing protein [Verrucomicrobiota bacterium]